MPRKLRLVALLGTVAVISVLSDLGFQMAADAYPNSGFAKLRSYTTTPRGN